VHLVAVLFNIDIQVCCVHCKGTSLHSDLIPSQKCHIKKCSNMQPLRSNRTWRLPVSFNKPRQRLPTSAKLKGKDEIDVHESMYLGKIVKITNKMQLCRSVYYSKSALHVSGDIFAHHQEHLTVFTVPGSVQPSCCRLPQAYAVCYVTFGDICPWKFP
jgi:hypothetical protein